jgi:hypothetical protein
VACEQDRPGEPPKVVAQQADGRGFASDVGAAAKCYSHIASRDSRGIVYAVANHRDGAEITAGLLYGSDLFFGK